MIAKTAGHGAANSDVREAPRGASVPQMDNLSALKPNCCAMESNCQALLAPNLLIDDGDWPRVLGLSPGAHPDFPDAVPWTNIPQYLGVPLCRQGAGGVVAAETDCLVSIAQVGM